MMSAEQITVTEQNKERVREALRAFVRSKESLEEILLSREIPCDVGGYKFMLTDPKEIESIIGIIREKLNPQ